MQTVKSDRLLEMKLVGRALSDVLIFEPTVSGDERGYFYESYNERELEQLGLRARFVQDNHARSARNVLRGLHYQIERAQGKLIRVTSGEIYDVAVDIRRGSPSFGQWAAHVLSGDNRRLLWIPPGFAHGYLVTADHVELLYKATDYWAPEHERCIIWNDRDLAIPWPLQGAPILSQKDRKGLAFRQAEVYA